MSFSERYPLKPFQSADPSRMAAVISAYPLATLISCRDPFPWVTQVPLIFDKSANVLRGHLDRNNPHCEALREGGSVYCVFSGPNHYISPSIYPETHYPGWNYIAVHVEGTVRAIEDPAWLRNLLLQTAAENEASDSGYTLRPEQAGFDDLLNYIVGFEIEVSDMRGIFKLAQDKGAANAELARQHLASVLQQDISPFLSSILHVDD